MPEGNGEAEPNEYRVFLDTIEGEFDSKTTIIDRFDLNNERLFDEFSAMHDRLYHDPMSDELLDIDYSIHATDMRAVVGMIFEDGVDMDANMQTVIDVLKVTSDQRFSRMNEVLNESTFKVVKRQHFEDRVLHLLAKPATYEKSIERIVSYYVSDLKADALSFTQGVQAKYSPEEYDTDETSDQLSTTQENTKGTKEHLVDLAKLAVAVTIALRLNKFLDRNN